MSKDTSPVATIGTYEQRELLNASADLARRIYALLPQFGDEERSGTQMTLRQAAGNQLADVSQAVGRGDLEDIVFYMGRVRGNVLSIRSGYKLMADTGIVELEIELMALIDQILRAVEREIVVAEEVLRKQAEEQADE